MARGAHRSFPAAFDTFRARVCRRRRVCTCVAFSMATGAPIDAPDLAMEVVVCPSRPPESGPRWLFTSRYGSKVSRNLGEFYRNNETKFGWVSGETLPPAKSRRVARARRTITRLQGAPRPGAHELVPVGAQHVHDSGDQWSQRSSAEGGESSCLLEAAAGTLVDFRTTLRSDPAVMASHESYSSIYAPMRLALFMLFMQ